MNATIKDVARKAGVSTATVSRAFNASPLVRKETLAHIKKVAKELRYSPNASARSLSTRRTGTLGILLPDLYGEFFSEVIRGVDVTARASRRHVIISSSHSNRDDFESALQAMRGKVDGLVIMSPHIDALTLTRDLPTHLPVVLLNCNLRGESYDSINVDNRQGAISVVQHLLEHGHRRIALIKGSAENIDAKERLEGYRHALKAAGVAVDPMLEVNGDFSETSGYAAAENILSIHPRPTAVFATNDSMAIGALSLFRSHGLQVPADIAVAGFDDIPISSFVRPSLTSVRIGLNELGGLAVNHLLELINSEKNSRPRQHVLPTRLIVRESCGCGARDRRVSKSDLAEPATMPAIEHTSN